MSQNSIPGSGTLEQIEDPHKGWIMRQIEEGNPIPSIKVEPGVNDSIRFARKVNRIALAIGEDYHLRRYFHKKSEDVFAFFYSVKGSFEHATVNQIKLVKELLISKFSDDFETIFFDYAPLLQRMVEAKISLQHSTVYLYVEIKFGKEWIPQDGFQEI